MKTILFVILGFFLSNNSLAEIYEIIDEDGNKTYTNTLPHDKTKEMPKKVTNKKANILKGDKTQLNKNNDFFEELAKQQKAEENKEDAQKQGLQAAYKQVKDAEAALEEAKVLKAGDYIRNKNGRIIRKPEYENRIKAAEAAHQEAKNNLKDNLKTTKQNK